MPKGAERFKPKEVDVGGRSGLLPPGNPSGNFENVKGSDIGHFRGLGGPGGPGTLAKGGGRSPPPFGGVSGAPGAAQTHKMADFRPLNKFLIPSQSTAPSLTMRQPRIPIWMSRPLGIWIRRLYDSAAHLVHLGHLAFA